MIEIPSKFLSYKKMFAIINIICYNSIVNEKL